MKTLQERLNYAMEQAGIKQVDLANYIGVSRPSVSGWFSGGTKNLKGDHLVKAAELLRVNTEWLASGKGPIQSNWPFRSITPLDIKQLEPETLEIIEEMIMVYIKRQTKKNNKKNAS